MLSDSRLHDPLCPVYSSLAQVNHSISKVSLYFYSPILLGKSRKRKLTTSGVEGDGVSQAPCSHKASFSSTEELREVYRARGFLRRPCIILSFPPPDSFLPFRVTLNDNILHIERRKVDIIGDALGFFFFLRSGARKPNYVLFEILEF